MIVVLEYYENVLKELFDGYCDVVKEFVMKFVMDEEEGLVMIFKSKTDSFVFFRFREDVVNFVMGEDDDGNIDFVDLKCGVIFLVKYFMFKDFFYIDSFKVEFV